MSFPFSEIPITIDAKSPQPSEYIRWTDHPQARTFEGLLPFSSCKILKIPPSLEDFPLYTFDTLSAHTSQFSSSSIIRTFSSLPRHHRTSLVSVFAAIRYPLRATPSFRRCVVRVGLQRLSCGVARRRSGWMVSAALSARLRPRACSSRSCASHFLTSEPAASHHFPPSFLSFRLRRAG